MAFSCFLTRSSVCRYESRPAQLYRKEIQDLIDSSSEKKGGGDFLAGYKQQAERASVDHDKREEEHKDETG